MSAAPRPSTTSRRESPRPSSFDDVERHLHPGDPRERPCRYLLAKVVTYQGQRPPRDRRGGELLQRLWRIAVQERRDPRADENACYDALGAVWAYLLETHGGLEGLAALDGEAFDLVWRLASDAFFGRDQAGEGTVH